MEKPSLLKYLVNSRLGSRRACFSMIKQGKVLVNGYAVTDPLAPVGKDEKVVCEGRTLKPDESLLEPVTILLYKPKGYVCSVKDEENKPSVLRLIRHKRLSRARLFPVGRLDFLTEGLLLITNEGNLANYITHPRYNVTKEYYLEVKGAVHDKEVKLMKKGVFTQGVLYRVLDVKVLSANEKLSRLLLTLNEGKNREIRNIFQVLKHKIRILRRVRVGPFTLDKDLHPGEYKLIPRKVVYGFLKKFEPAGHASR